MRTTATVMAAAALGILAACGGGERGGTGAGLAVSVRSAPATAAATADGLALPGGITLSRVRLAVRRISVEGGDAANACEPSGVTTTSSPLQAMMGGGPGPIDPSNAATSDDGRPDHGAQMGDDGACELAFGPFDVDLAGSALSGGVDFAFSAPIPAGTYREVSISVNTVPATRAAGNPVLEALAAAHASILVDGFVQETSTLARPFTFSTPLEVKQKRERDLVIGPSSNVTLTFDPSAWFLSNGARLDPADPTAQGAILANIRASLRLLHDDDHDGLDDDRGHR